MNSWYRGDLTLYEHIEKCKEVTVACNFGTACDKHPRNAILLGLGNQHVSKKCIEVGKKLTSAHLIWIDSEVYNADRQLSIMQSLSGTATSVQNPSVSELNVVKTKHRSRGAATGDRDQGT